MALMAKHRFTDPSLQQYSWRYTRSRFPALQAVEKKDAAGKVTKAAAKKK